MKDKRQKQAEKNRKEMPNVAALIDQLTILYGPMKVLGAEDKVTGKKIGKLWDE